MKLSLYHKEGRVMGYKVTGFEQFIFNSLAWKFILGKPNWWYVNLELGYNYRDNIIISYNEGGRFITFMDPFHSYIYDHINLNTWKF